MAFWDTNKKNQEEIKRLENRVLELGNTNNDLKNKNRELKDHITKIENIFRDLRVVFDKHIEVKKKQQPK
jgi:hypothetical protein